MKRFFPYDRPGYPVAFFSVITIVIIGLSTSFLLWDLRKREIEHGRQETISVARILAAQTERSFENIGLVLKGVQDKIQSDYGQQLSLDSVPVQLLLRTYAIGARQLDLLYVVDDKGRIVNASVPEIPKGLSVADRDYFKALYRAKSDGTFIGKPILNNDLSRWMLPVARRIDDSSGFRGIVVALIDVSRFIDIFNALKIDYPRPISLYRDDGILIAGIPNRNNLISELAPELSRIDLKRRELGFYTLRPDKGSNQTEEFALASIPKFPLFVGVVNEDAEPLASWRETAVPIIFGATMVILFIIIAAAFLVRELIREQALARELGEANNRYHLTIDSVMDAIIAVDTDQNILLFNPAAERMFGRTAAEMVGQSMLQLIPERYRGQHPKHVGKFMVSEKNTVTMAPQLGIVGLRADGTEFPLESTVAKTMFNGRLQLTAVFRDVTDRRRAENDLREKNRQLSELAERLLSIREEEQARIAMELHDELGQHLTGLKLDLSWLSNRVKEGRSIEPCRVDELRRQLDVAIVSVRRISSELRPVILADLGFCEAVKWLVQEFIKRTGVNVRLDFKEEMVVSNPALATALFRVVQESLTNITRHAHASEVTISLTESDTFLNLEIRDNGQGFVVDQHKDGFGLISIRERAYAFGAEFKISSAAGAGTTISLKIPKAFVVEQSDA